MNPIRRRSTRASRAYRPPGALLPFSSPSAIFLPSDSDTDDSALASLASLSTSPLLSIPSGQSSPANSSQESATEISDAVHKLMRKDTGFSGRFTRRGWPGVDNLADRERARPVLMVTTLWTLAKRMYLTRKSHSGTTFRLRRPIAYKLCAM